MLVAVFIGAVTLLSFCHGDVFFHNPRGSNNRLDETTANRNNNNRLFDSQNNNKGGYNTGDLFDKAAGNDSGRQYSMKYYGSGKDASSKLMLEWTNQHGCGGNDKLDCNIVIQYMCMNNETSSEGRDQKTLYMRDGTDRKSQGYRSPNKGESDRSYTKRMSKNYDMQVKLNRGLHETLEWYDMCRYREANGGLFTADQNLAKDNLGYVTASRTRQNSDGGRSGYECPEERDHFPYWTPTLQTENWDATSQRTPWIDAAWLGTPGKCGWMKRNSFNNKAKYRCVLSKEEGKRKYGRSINKADCEAEQGNWVKFNSFLEVLSNVTTAADCKEAAKSKGVNNILWDKLRSDDESEACIVQAPTMQCRQAPWTRANHLGNAYNFGKNNYKDLNASRIELDLPYFPSGEAKRCVLRIRYNISTTDYDGWNTDSSSNDNDDVISDNPTIDVFGDGSGFKLALNTAQTGRVFQDRSHVFEILPRTDAMEGKTIYNLNVMGKRGNLEQTVPSTEYDFVPSSLAMKTDDLVHIQWTGSNTHNNNNDGNAGEGTAGTDRSNLMQMNGIGENYPYTIAEADFWDNVESLTDPDATGVDIAIGLASAGYYCSKSGTDICPAAESLDGKTTKIDKKMNNAPASYFGHVLKFKKACSMNYLCTRNNSFSNRSQKGSIWVRDASEDKKPAEEELKA